MKRYKSKNVYMPQYGCPSSYECMPPCEPMPQRSIRRYVGTYNTQYRIYENCSYDICKVCACCGHEYDDEQHDKCPMCGAPVGVMSMADPPNDPPGFGGFGGRRFGNFGGFGRRRFGGFGFFPFFPFFFPFGRFSRFRRF